MKLKGPPMARGRKSEFTIAELQKLLDERKAGVNRLMKQRVVLLKRLAKLDREIAAAGGTAGPADGRGLDRTPTGRVRNGLPLVETMESVMKGRGPMRVGEIYDAVVETGYSSVSGNFRGIVNQTLIKDKRFSSPQRGKYVLK